MLSDSSCRSPAAAELDHLVFELGRVRDRLRDAHATARSLSSLTDWRSRAAVAFHERAEGWARDVGALGVLAEEARTETSRARDRAAFEAVFQTRCA